MSRDLGFHDIVECLNISVFFTRYTTLTLVFVLRTQDYVLPLQDSSPKDTCRFPSDWMNLSRKNVHNRLSLYQLLTNISLNKESFINFSSPNCFFNGY